MLSALPITNVRLAPCSVGPEQLTPVSGGHYCSGCRQLVHDFTRASAADLRRAQAATPDGQLCGRFRLSQLAPESRPAQLRPGLRRFLLAAVLVLVLGLPARQAWAQVQVQGRPAAPFKLAPKRLHQRPGGLPTAPAPPDTVREERTVVFGGVMEKMPVPPGGMEGLLQFLSQHLRYPATVRTEGRVFVSFIVQADGQLTDFAVLKSLDPVLDAEALRVLRLMPAWTPGAQHHRPVPVRFTVPITFRREAEPAAKRR